jgi:mono/diheme cytochrome c family protein
MNKSAKTLFQRLGSFWPVSLHMIFPFLLAFLFLVLAGGVLAQAGVVPAEPPDAASGLPIHQERCATCHGLTGQGDGELAANLPNPPAAHGSTEYLRTAIPSEMFDVITNGRVPRGMPPFGPESSNPLSEAERWDVIAAIYSFGTPLESVESGQVFYDENCLTCHGEGGFGDGPEAASLDADPGDLTSLDYWFNTSNQAVFEILTSPDRILEHQYDISDDDIWSVVDYVRAFSYGYIDALAPMRPLESASISGQVFNGTTGSILDSEATALLRAFTQDLEITLTMSDTLDAEGRFNFALTDVPQDWFFRVGLTYNDVEFGSDFGQVTLDQPDLDLPITVFEKTVDPSSITVQQMHLILVFDQNQVVVNELYVVGNDEAAVFAGETGDPNEGTFKITVPNGAEQLSFQRGFGSVDSFIPANEVIQTDSGWADTLPLRPGPGSLTMLVQYTLPYEDGLTISQPVNYDTTNVNLVVPEIGVSLGEGDGWVSGGTQTMEGGTVTSYAQTNIPAGQELVLTLEGRPRSGNSTTANLVSDNALELVIGLGAAVLVIGIAAVAIRRWRLEPEEEYLDRDQLLQEMADLDDAYEAGEISEEEYQGQRQELKAELMEIWEDQTGT